MGLKLESTITLNSASFERGMERVKEVTLDSVKNFAIAAIGVAGIEEAFRRTIETASDLVNQSKELNIPIEKLQVLQQAAKDAGVDVGSLTMAMEKLNQARAMALGAGLTGDMSEKSEYLQMFQKLGVAESQLNTMSASDIIFGPIKDKLKNTDPEKIIEPLREIIGRAGGQIIPMFSTNLSELEEEMKKTGAIMDAEVAAKLKVVGDEFDIMSRVITSQLAPALLALAEWVYKIANKTAGKVAGAGAFYGQVSVGMQAAPNDPNNKNRMKDGRLNFWKELRDQIFDPKKNGAAIAAASGAEKPFDLNIKQFEEMLKNAAEKTKVTMPATNFLDMEKTKQTSGSRIPTDSLVKVGNFLGSNVGVKSASNLAMQTANNTKRAADTLDKIRIELPKAFTSKPSLGFSGLGLEDITMPNQ